MNEVKVIYQQGTVLQLKDPYKNEKFKLVVITSELIVEGDEAFSGTLLNGDGYEIGSFTTFETSLIEKKLDSFTVKSN